MKFSSDHYFTIGYEHIISGHPCQDHGLSNHNGARACAVVSDGCSSGKETDMGARIITFTTLKALEEVMEMKVSPELLIPLFTLRSKSMREESAQALGLSRDDLLATRLFAFATSAYAYARIEGDGVLALKRRDGSVCLKRYDWAYNTPCYPSYDIDDYKLFTENQQAYEEQGLSETVYDWSNENGFTLASQKVYSIEESVHGRSEFFEGKAFEELSVIAVLSDGVTRIEGLDWKDATLQMLAYKNYAGQFVKRRMIRIAKDWAKEGIRSLDDLSCASIYFDHQGDSHDHD